jgi:hypothetical protein
MQNILSWIQPPTQQQEQEPQRQKRRHIGFADVKYAVQHDCLLINTLLESLQGCLINNTVVAKDEEDTINELIDDDDMDRIIVLYGANAADSTVEKKWDDFKELGFRRVYIYSGGLFEWLLLQDIYGDSEFATTSKIADLLTFQPKKILSR